MSTFSADLEAARLAASAAYSAAFDAAVARPRGRCKDPLARAYRATKKERVAYEAAVLACYRAKHGLG